MKRLVACLCLVMAGSVLVLRADGGHPLAVMLVATVDDHVNGTASVGHLEALLALMRRARASEGGAGSTCLVRFSGAMVEYLEELRPINPILDRLIEAQRDGLIEVGYDGTSEPTWLARPRANLRGTQTGEERWLAQSQAAQWFLSEGKGLLTGEPDASKTGGFDRVRRVFGNVVAARGLSTSAGSDSEITHRLRQRQPSILLNGLLAPSELPVSSIFGYRTNVDQFGARISPAWSTLPEVFWADGMLRVTEAGRVFDAEPGPDALAKALEGLDRSRPRLVQIRLASPRIYAKEAFGARRHSSPLEYAYDNPKTPALPDDARRSATEVADAHAREGASVMWLLDSFLPKNPGSRVVSAARLNQAVMLPLRLTRDDLMTIASSLWRAPQTSLPRYVRIDDRYLSNAEAFGVLVQALAARVAATPPDVLKVEFLYGPLDIQDRPADSCLAAVRVADVVAAATALAPRLAPGEWADPPRNAVPPTVRVGATDVNAAQFLALMAGAYLAGSADETLAVPAWRMFSEIGDMWPRTRDQRDLGTTWTLKPADLMLIVGPPPPGVTWTNPTSW